MEEKGKSFYFCVRLVAGQVEWRMGGLVGSVVCDKVVVCNARFARNCGSYSLTFSQREDSMQDSI